MKEFDIDGKNYRMTKLPAFEQFHVSRKIAPLIPKLIPVFIEIAKGKNLSAADKENASKMDLSAIAAVMQPFADGLASMSNEDAEYVMSTCLSVVKRNQQGNWADVWIQKAQAMAFDDANDIGSMLPLVFRVIQDSLGPFIQGMLISQMATAASPD